MNDIEAKENGAMSDIEKNSRNRGAVVLGWALVGLGALFLVFQVLGVSLISVFWPFFIIIPGLLFFVGMIMGGKSASPLAIPGSVITGTGLLLFYQAITGHWASWAYAWSLYPGFVGVGIIIHCAWSGRRESMSSGVRLIGISAVMFLILGAFFELFLNISGDNPMGNVMWPGLVILVGVFLLLRGRKPSSPQPSGNGSQVTFEPIDMSRTSRRRSGKKAEEKSGQEETIAE
jgi:hypothetical protein